jgi:hypothetical protein
VDIGADGVFKVAEFLDEQVLDSGLIERERLAIGWQPVGEVGGIHGAEGQWSRTDPISTSKKLMVSLDCTTQPEARSCGSMTSRAICSGFWLGDMDVRRFLILATLERNDRL